ncbi:MAG: hypothetical protein KF709_10640 [Gemmatimonadaceae bacterium]|nr:hypothetical protein [Gemmatimonadaceae bacterium]
MGIADILVVAATARELAPPQGWGTLLCGVGPVDAAARTANALAAAQPRAVLHVGIAGARRRAALAPGSLVIGSASLYTDLIVPPEFGSSEILPDHGLLRACSAAFPDAPCLPIATAARVGASAAGDVEAMEGFGVLRAAALAAVPAIELRVISNEVEETDRARWHFEAAFDALHRITPRLVEAVASCVN